MYLLVPRSLDDVKYRMNDGYDKKGKVAVCHIEGGRFRNTKIQKLSYWLKRKMENLFMLTYTKHRVKFVYE